MFSFNQARYSMYYPGGGYSHVKTYMDVLQFWVIFLQEIPLNHEKICNYGSDFQNFLCKPWEMLQIRCVFAAKSQEMGTFFQKNPQICSGYLF